MARIITTGDIESCCSKRSYSYSDAHYTINQAHRPRSGLKKRSKKIPWRAYKCPQCHTWHLTSKRFDKGYDNN